MKYITLVVTMEGNQGSTQLDILWNTMQNSHRLVPPSNWKFGVFTHQLPSLWV